MDRLRVAIIGAGVSGLVAVKTCLEEGLEPVCFEKEHELGGLWVYRDEVGSDPRGPAGIYKGLITNVSKEMMAFSDFSFPRHAPPYLTSDDVVQYLQSYAEHFDLMKHVHFNTSVVEVTKSQDYEKTGRWNVCTQSQGEEPKTESFDAVMMCSGIYTSGNIPDYPGMSGFKGQIRHSGQFRGGKEFMDKTIVVVGSCHSAGDVAVLSTSHAKKVYLSLRDGAWIVPRLVAKQPADVWANRRWIHLVPPWLYERLLNLNIKSMQDWKTLGIQKSLPPSNSSIMMNDELPMKIMSGQVVVRSGLERFEGSKVIFDDGSSLEDVDYVVFATGYNPKIYMKDDVISGSSSQLDLYLHVVPPRLEHPTLAAIGYVMTRGTLGPTAELQSRFAVKMFKKELQLPSASEMLADVKRRRDAVLQQYNEDKPKIHPTKYNDELAKAIGARPSFWNLLVSDPKLAYRFFFGPAFPSWFRLVGPHSKPDARRRILQSGDDLIHGITLRTVRPRALSRLEGLQGGRMLSIKLVAACVFVLSLAVMFWS
ncbi:flavin-containing monooxygenase 5-like [Lytechinus variegatus]|uniref:flavin-containing monooxygenase 5-like n=1 Tax=Lytechinus variegatus TaxID=7654 RepID=UPI001BB25980|nr:flavin-containing monooxygenase 5-like [Lytechinus variegatus]